MADKRGPADLPNMTVFTPPSASSAAAGDGLRALVVGGTGQVGRHILSAALSHPAFTSALCPLSLFLSFFQYLTTLCLCVGVYEYGRTTTAKLASNPKLTQRTIDFEALDPADFLLDGRGFDVVFIAYVLVSFPFRFIPCRVGCAVRVDEMGYVCWSRIRDGEAGGDVHGMVPSDALWRRGMWMML